MSGRILLVDDEPEMLRVMAEALGARGYDTTTSRDAAAALERVHEDDDYDVVITDVNMRGTSGIELTRRIVALRPETPVIVITAFGSLETAIETLRAGAFDFRQKPIDVDELVLSIERAMHNRALRREVRRLRDEIARARPLPGLVASSESMRQVAELIHRVAPTDATVLVTGESGTGKELVARALHAESRRASGPFVAINCAALPEHLLESELFGHAKGAFTDARSAHKGLFAEADGGTLFLDEIGEMPSGMQAKLLRALETKRVRPVGATREVEYDARLVAATNRDVEAMVAERTFREDLYYRINVVHIDLPPLRARGNDVLELAQHFLVRHAERAGKAVRSFSPAAAERLLAYPWPGNVRELQNAIERAVTLARYDAIALEDLPPRVREHATTSIVVATDTADDLVSMEEIERRYIVRVLDAVGQNKSQAAKVLGFDRTTLYRKLERYGLAPRE